MLGHIGTFVARVRATVAELFTDAPEFWAKPAPWPTAQEWEALNARIMQGQAVTLPTGVLVSLSRSAAELALDEKHMQANSWLSHMRSRGNPFGISLWEWSLGMSQSSRIFNLDRIKRELNEDGFHV